MKQYKRIVVKVGTKVITSKDKALEKDRIKDLVEQIADVQDKGTKVILVTSGAIGAGMSLLNIKKRPTELSLLQAAASIGQSHLIQLYSDYFKARGYLVGQILLTQEDFDNRQRYLNIKNTVEKLLKHNAIPIINENDTVATDEIKCGDNDRLSGLMSDLCRADKLIILTDVDGLLDEDGSVVSSVSGITPRILKLGGVSHCDLGTGGMETKLEAARYVNAAGIDCVIADGRSRDVILKVMKEEAVGTVFRSGKVKFIAKKRWIAFSSKPKGAITVDSGAKEAISGNDKSLLASGILSVHGDFDAGDVIGILDKHRTEFAKGLANYSSLEISKIKGHKTANFKPLLGYEGPDEVIHKDNLVIL